MGNSYEIIEIAFYFPELETNLYIFPTGAIIPKYNVNETIKITNNSLKSTMSVIRVYTGEFVPLIMKNIT